ncbi:MAG: hypothetical protein HZA37_01275 [Parcubacteria group bacterium]|nr:hypothetical protein [Parcubacteria group bacterium]
MPNTVREDIFQNVKTALQAITQANGFDNNMGSIQQWDPNGNAYGAMPMVIINSGPESDVDDAFPLTTCRLTIFLTLWTRIDEGSSTPADTVLNSLLGDIKKKLKEDIARGGKAVDTKIGEIEPFDVIQGQGEVGLIITIEVLYRHSQTDPKEVR